jgi:hypothetical protein
MKVLDDNAKFSFHNGRVRFPDCKVKTWNS